MTLKEYLYQEEEILSPVTQIKYSDLTKELFKMAYLEFYYFVRGNIEKVEEFLRLSENKI